MIKNKVDFKILYKKYKKKYLNLKNQYAGMLNEESNNLFFLIKLKEAIVEKPITQDDNDKVIELLQNIDEIKYVIGDRTKKDDTIKIYQPWEEMYNDDGHYYLNNETRQEIKSRDYALNFLKIRKINDADLNSSIKNGNYSSYCDTIIDDSNKDKEALKIIKILCAIERIPWPWKKYMNNEKKTYYKNINTKEELYSLKKVWNKVYENFELKAIYINLHFPHNKFNESVEMIKKINPEKFKTIVQNMINEKKEKKKVQFSIYGIHSSDDKDNIYNILENNYKNIEELKKRFNNEKTIYIPISKMLGDYTINNNELFINIDSLSGNISPPKTSHYLLIMLIEYLKKEHSEINNITVELKPAAGTGKHYTSLGFVDSTTRNSHLAIYNNFEKLYKNIYKFNQLKFYLNDEFENIDLKNYLKT